MPAARLSSCPYLKTYCDFSELLFFPPLSISYPQKFSIPVSECLPGFLYFFYINLKSPEKPLSENFLKSLFCVENGSGNTPTLAGVGTYVCIRSFGVTSSPLALIPPDFLCREEGGGFDP